jgi:hypothetical protein
MTTLTTYKDELTRIAKSLLESKINETQDDWWHSWTLSDGQVVDLNVWIDDETSNHVVTAYMVNNTGDIDTKNYLRLIEQPARDKGGV